MPPLDNNVFLPIQVGRALTDTDIHIQSDNEVDGQPCDNISAKNACYCELTAVYWAWKNLRRLYPGVNYVGLFHYRRFLELGRRKFLGDFIVRPEQDIKNYRLNVTDIIKQLEAGKVFVSDEFIYSVPLMIHYCLAAYSEDYRILKSVIRAKFPDYYDTFIDVMERGNKFTGYNLFVMKYDDFERYCEWIFSVLNEVETRSYWQDYSAEQKRFLGGIPECIMRVWLIHNKKNIRPCNMYLYQGNESRNPSRVKHFARLIINNITAKLLSFRKDS